jgi:hypothetical protein
MYHSREAEKLKIPYVEYSAYFHENLPFGIPWNSAEFNVNVNYDGSMEMWK